MSPFRVLPRVLAKPLRWPTDSARQARRNAYAATAALAVRRAEREDVDRFLSEHGLVEQSRVVQSLVAQDVVEQDSTGSERGGERPVVDPTRVSR